MGGFGLNLSESGLVQVRDCCENSDEPSGSIKFWKILV